MTIKLITNKQGKVIKPKYYKKYKKVVQALNLLINNFLSSLSNT